MLPLWSPSHVDLGSVGYYSKTTSEFITLFNAFQSFKLPNRVVLPSLFTSGEFSVRYVRRCATISLAVCVLFSL
ncbi:hypothetical protein F5I97DRAFT_652562 [Phlebopus sp. FC_14]|nr:hypothetical protein F5I97DRAFT_652562 [Phlebopus sp. FC_14]